jgi:hypothetical protein
MFRHPSETRVQRADLKKHYAWSRRDLPRVGKMRQRSFLSSTFLSWTAYGRSAQRTTGAQPYASDSVPPPGGALTRSQLPAQRKILVGFAASS